MTSTSTCPVAKALGAPLKTWHNILIMTYDYKWGRHAQSLQAEGKH